MYSLAVLILCATVYVVNAFIQVKIYHQVLNQ